MERNVLNLEIVSSTNLSLNNYIHWQIWKEVWVR